MILQSELFLYFQESNRCRIEKPYLTDKEQNVLPASANSRLPAGRTLLQNLYTRKKDCSKSHSPYSTVYLSSSLRYSAAKDASVQVSWLRDQRARLPSRSTVAYSTALLHYSGGTAQDSHLLPSQLLTDYPFRRTQSRIFNLFSVF